MSINRLSEKKALERIIQFTQRFGEAHFELACHAAFPALLTPDLLSRIWANFLMYTPWTAISDILLSPLCREVGYELYEMDASIKELLLDELRETFDYGGQRLDQLDRFMKEYISLYLTSNNPDDQDIALAHHWTALAQTQPDQAAQEIALALENLAEQGGIEMIRIASLVDSLSRPLDNYKPLLSYARGIFHLSRQEMESAVNQFQTIFEDNAPLQIAGVQLDLPDAVLPYISKTTETFEAPSSEDYQRWKLPKIEEILEDGISYPVDWDFDQQRAQIIEETLASFGAPGTVVEISQGPTITMFGVEPGYDETRKGRTRVRVSKITGLADDLALALAAQRIRIQAPVPGKNYIGIEVPNQEPSLVTLRDGIESEAFQRLKSRPLRFVLGKDVAGKDVVVDLAEMPHLLIGGATGSGKSICINAMISCLLMNNSPDELRFIMVDPKRVELTSYNGIPHLLIPVITDVERVASALQWVTREMDSRYRKFANVGSRHIGDYNLKAEELGHSKLPFLVVIIDELADLMMLAPDETEKHITRLAQLARAAGIHMVVSTQRPSVDVITGLIKANFPARIAFAVSSGVDSRVIIDQTGAESLLGRGDMLFFAPDASAPVRLQGVYVSDPEILRTVQYWRSYSGMSREEEQLPIHNAFFDEMKVKDQDEDPIYQEAVDLVRKRRSGSISMLQRGLRIGYARAARIMDQMEENGIVGPALQGSRPREVLDYGYDFESVYLEAVQIARDMRLVSPNSLQRRLKINAEQTAQIITRMENDGIVSKPQGGETIRRLLDVETPGQSQSEERQVDSPVVHLPSLDLLLSEEEMTPNELHINQQAGLIEKTLADFGIPAKVVGYSVGPTVTQFAVDPGYFENSGDDAQKRRVSVSQIAELSSDIALALAIGSIRVQAQIPGRPYVGIEVPNTQSSIVRLKPILEEDAFKSIQSALTIGLGRDVSGNPVVADLAALPHLLIAGTTGSGKSVCIATIATCLVMNNRPDELKLVMLDPKMVMVELARFNGLPHLYGSVETDLNRILGVLRWLVFEMESRYELLEQSGTRNITSYNKKQSEDGEKLPNIVVFIDELADLMMFAANDIEEHIVRLGQLARATGIHLVVATQRPSVDVVTGVIKASIPARISFATASSVDSRTIIDVTGAESLLGRGDMLFVSPNDNVPVRLQGAWVTDQEVQNVTAYWRNSVREIDKTAPWEKYLTQDSVFVEPDDRLEEAVRLVAQNQQASISMLQRRLKIGYVRASRLMDQLEDLEVVGPNPGGGKARDVLIGVDDVEDFI